MLPDDPSIPPRFTPPPREPEIPDRDVYLFVAIVALAVFGLLLLRI